MRLNQAQSIAVALLAFSIVGFIGYLVGIGASAAGLPTVLTVFTVIIYATIAITGTIRLLDGPDLG